MVYKPGIWHLLLPQTRHAAQTLDDAPCVAPISCTQETEEGGKGKEGQEYAVHMLERMFLPAGALAGCPGAY